MIALASSNDLATLTGRDADDAALTLALRRASGIIRSYTGQTISRVPSDTAKLHAGRARLVLPERPVNALASITVLRWGPLWMPIGDAPFGPLPVDAYTWDGGDQVALAFARSWPELVEVTYDHGYASIPDEIEDACLTIAQRSLANPDALTNERIGNYSYTTAVHSGELADLEMRVLNKYRRRTNG